MLLFWRIRYLDTRDKEYKDRDLWLDTETLDAVTKAAVETTHGLTEPGGGRPMLRYRHLFREQKQSGQELNDLCTRHGGMSTVSILDYFEDENGKELTPERRGQVLTGDPDVAIFPAGTRQHDIDFMFAPNPNIDLRNISLAQDEVDSLSYFLRDTKELVASEFFQNGPGTLELAEEPRLETATSADEIRSFVTVFRRLYMTKEPGCFVKACKAFSRKVDHPIGRWVQGECDEYLKALKEKVDRVALVGPRHITFTQKNILDAFIYTRFAHQPQESRIKQYNTYLAEAESEDFLEWLFYSCAYSISAHFVNVMVRIEGILEGYLRLHGGAPSFTAPPLQEKAGLAVLEKEQDRQKRIFREKCEELARKLWEESGCPEGGPEVFLPEAEGLLRDALAE